MVSSILCYIDGAGGLHRCAADAHRADLQHWLKATGSVNEATASTLANLLVEDREKMFELTSMLEAVARDTGETTDE